MSDKDSYIMVFGLNAFMVHTRTCTWRHGGVYVCSMGTLWLNNVAVA